MPAVFAIILPCFLIFNLEGLKRLPFGNSLQGFLTSNVPDKTFNVPDKTFQVERKPGRLSGKKPGRLSGKNKKT